MGFKILNLDMKAFADICCRLQTIVDDSGFKPDVIIPVPRGGNRVASRLYTGLDQIPVLLERPPKGKLKRGLAAVLRLLPGFMLDALRIAEARILVRKRNHMEQTKIHIPELKPWWRNILIVDDAVDSGATLKAVVEGFAALHPDRDIRTAVITVTGSDIVYTPDYFVLNNRTLIRTPWSIDARTPSSGH